MPYRAILLPKAEKHYRYWEKHRPDYAAKNDELIEAIKQDPFNGIGRPEQLKHGMRGYWSRHITEKHRILYKVEYDLIIVHRCYGHYL